MKLASAKLTARKATAFKSILNLVIAGFAVISLSAVGSNAHAQLIDRVTGDQLEAALSSANLNPKIISDSATGAPVAKGKAGQFEFYVRAMSCTGSPSACENLMFFANFQLGRGVTAQDYQIVNQFNESQVFGRAYVIGAKNEVGIDYVVELGGGVSEAHLSENIGRWADVISAFVEKFSAGAASS